MEILLYFMLVIFFSFIGFILGNVLLSIISSFIEWIFSIFDKS